MKRKHNNVMHYAFFKSPYPGNFIASLEYLRQAAEKEGRETVYLFPPETARRQWAQELSEKAPVYYLSGNILKDIFFVRKTVKKHGIGIIHSHFYKLPQVFIFTFAGVKQIIHLHCAVYRHTGLQGIIEKLLLKKKTFIGCSEKLTRDIKSIYPDAQAYTAKNAIFFPRLEKFTVLTREEAGIAPSSDILLMFGFLYEVKGVDIALKALDSLVKSGRDIVLMLVLSSNRQEIEDKIKETYGGIPPWLRIMPPRTDVAAYYDLCDCFIAPSRSEGLPYSVPEAMWMKVPMVLSDIPAHKNLRLFAANYFESENPEDLEKEIINALDHPHSPEEMREQAKEIYGEYNLDRWSGEVLKVYRR